MSKILQGNVMAIKRAEIRSGVVDLIEKSAGKKLLS